MRFALTARIGLFLLAVATAAADPVGLLKERFLDKCKGAWAGQMIGVCYGAPYEFRSNGKPIVDELKPWMPDRVTGAIDQDDCYVEMTFLMCLEDYGLEATHAQAGQAFAETQYPLWHANFYGRENCRRGILPPLSGHPAFNRHADDIDFQIEADLFGILCPGLPNESNRLCDVFGHVMNYGDGVYGGMFVSGMYAAAYFEDSDVEGVVRAGLACIPEASLYHACISDVLAWHDEQPNDWLATWKRIEEKWQDDVDCERGDTFNIDAKLNGAYIVMGLLYGEGDFEKTVEIGTRCGQDADCNPSNALGVLGCMKGFEAMGAAWTGGIASIADTPFSHTRYSFNSLIPACQRLTEQIVIRAGGSIDSDAYRIPRQVPNPPDTFEQWTNQLALLDQLIPQSEVALWNPAWRVVACGADMSPGYRREYSGRSGVLAVHPVSQDKPAVLIGTFQVPDGSPRLRIETASDRQGDYQLGVSINAEPKLEELVDTKGDWRVIEIELTPYTGKSIDVRIENRANGWSYEAAYFATVELVER